MAFQVFISYAREDDRPFPPPGAGPSNGFLEALEMHLLRKFSELGPPEIALWRDKWTTEPSDRAGPMIQTVIADSEAMIVILSPRWTASPSCRDELKVFTERWSGEGEEAVKKRIVLVPIHHVATEQRPPILQGQQGHEFYRLDHDGPGREQAYFQNGKSGPEFIERADGVAEDVWQRARNFGIPVSKAEISPVRPASPEPKTPGNLSETTPIDRVGFSVFAPAAVPPRSSFVLSVWASLQEPNRASEPDNPRRNQREEMLRRASAGGRLIEAGTRAPVQIPTSSDLALAVELNGFDIPEPVDVLTWEGEIANVSFVVTAGDLVPGSYPGTVRVSRLGLLVTRVVFEIIVGVGVVDRPVQLSVGQRNIRSAFASYASDDREAVLGRVQGMRATGIDVFLDVLTLRAASDWEAALRRAIAERDVLYLFWSPAALASPWVEREWRMALEEKGLDFIWPVPLADPRDAPPPDELRARHFNDDILAHIAVEHHRTVSAAPPSAAAPPPNASAPPRSMPRAGHSGARRLVASVGAAAGIVIVGMITLLPSLRATAPTERPQIVGVERVPVHPTPRPFPAITPAPKIASVAPVAAAASAGTSRPNRLNAVPAGFAATANAGMFGRLLGCDSGTARIELYNDYASSVYFDAELDDQDSKVDPKEALGRVDRSHLRPGETRAYRVRVPVCAATMAPAVTDVRFTPDDSGPVATP